MNNARREHQAITGHFDNDELTYGIDDDYDMFFQADVLPIVSESTVESTSSLSEAIAPFNHQQYWLLNWMSRALVSQTMQSKFYKVSD